MPHDRKHDYDASSDGTGSRHSDSCWCRELEYYTQIRLKSGVEFVAKRPYSTFEQADEFGKALLTSGFIDGYEVIQRQADESIH